MFRMLFTVGFLLFGLNALSQVTDADYSAVAQDICDCMNKTTEKMSPEMKKIIIDSEGDEQKMEELALSYALENPEVVSSDIEILENTFGKDMETCFYRLDSKYEDLDSDETEDEIAQRLLKALSTKEDCQFSYALIKFSLELEEEAQEKPVIPLDDPIYNELAKDACNCVNQSISDLSPEMKQVIIDSDGDERKLQELMSAYASEKPEQAMEDSQKMQGSMVENIGSCMEELEIKYDEVYTEESEMEVQLQLLTALKYIDGCECAYAFMKFGLEE